MPNVISAEKRSVTYLENRKVIAWMQEVARARGVDLSVILREATSAYFVQNKGEASAGLMERRAATKAAQRRETARKIRKGELTAEAAQTLNAPIQAPVRVVNLWPAIKRLTAASKG